MIVKLNARGTGGGSGPVDYLCGRDRQRAGAEVLRGNPEQTRALIDGNPYAQRYTSGVLSFEEAELSPEVKRQIMDNFEATLLPGLEPDQYDILWVEHADKGRVELNFVVPDMELTTGKRLQPYYHASDSYRINAWKTAVNAEHGLHDPDDPANRRALSTPQDLPPDKQAAARQITNGLLALAERGEVETRDDVVAALESGGFEVTRQTKSSISIADPDGGNRPLRLRGRIYERDFTASAELRAEIERASGEYRRDRQARAQRAREAVAEGVERKREQNQRRYPRPTPAPRQDRGQELARGPDPGRDHAAASGGDELVAREPHPGPDPDHPAPRGGRRRDAAREVRGEPTAVREDRPGSAGVQGRIPDTGGVLDGDRDRADPRGYAQAAIERVRAATQRVIAGARDLADRVRAAQQRERAATQPDRELERAGAAVERADRAAERATDAVAGLIAERERQQQRGHGPELSH